VGIRRCGKSTILGMLHDDLLNSGIPVDHIISMRYSSLGFDGDLTAKQMYDNIRKQIVDKQMYYLLLDEVQEVNGWEKAVNSLLEDYQTDIYVTGSNSRLMAGEISTYLSGRYLSIPVYPLSFKEYLSFKNNSDISVKDALQSYIRLGGFPIVALQECEDIAAYRIVEDIYASVITYDISRRHNIENFDLFNRVVRFVVENVGKTLSASAITKFLKSEGRSLTVETVHNYLSWLEKAFIVYRCTPYDLQGKAVLKAQEKFYLADPTLKYCIMGYDTKSVASMMENLVFFELKRHGYQVFVGKSGTKEIDFVATRYDKKVYVQVCRQLPEHSEREIGNLLDIHDPFPKYVVTLNEGDVGTVDGVPIVHLADFLLQDEY